MSLDHPEPQSMDLLYDATQKTGGALLIIFLIFIKKMMLKFAFCRIPLYLRIRLACWALRGLARLLSYSVSGFTILIVAAIAFGLRFANFHF
jgi:hypothetical protein